MKRPTPQLERPAFIRALASGFGLRVAGMGLAFLLGMQLARLLGPVGYGIYGIAVSVFALLTVPAEFGLSHVVTREIACRPLGSARPILKWALAQGAKCVLAVSVVAFFAFMAFQDQLSRELRFALVWVVPQVCFVAMSNILASALRGMGFTTSSQLSEILLRPAVTLLLLNLTLVAGGEIHAHSAVGLSAAGGAAGLGYVAWRVRGLLDSNGATPQEVPEQQTHEWKVGARKIAVGEALRVLSGHAGVLILGLVATTADAGVYRVAASLYTVSLLPSSLFAVVLGPAISAKYAAGDWSSLHRLARWASTSLAIASAIGATLCFLVGETAIRVIFGEEFGPAVDVLLIMLVGEALASLLGLSPLTLNMIRLERAATGAFLFSAAVTICLSVICGAMFGAVGAALALVAGQLVLRGRSAWVAYRTSDLHTSVLAWTRAVSRNG